MEKNSNKKGNGKNILWGLLFILSAVLLILNALGINFKLPESIPVWKIILSLALLFWCVEQLIKKHIENIFFPLIFIVMQFEKEIAHLLNIESGDIASTWTFLLIGLLLTVGTALIFKSSSFKFIVKSSNDEYVYTGKEGEEKFKEVLNQNSIFYIDCSEPINKKIEVNMGKTEIFFTNADLYTGNGKINIDNNMGKTIFHLPCDLVADCNIDNSLGSIKMAKYNGEPENQKHIEITGSNNMGKIEFIYD